ncbi:MAG: protein-L-isoaspartate(D-aspartate) O-methyltransferase [Candidatus Omnitrophica bacterium]|nr:protein-L-isoaspartate(D-aspartate) O-methyltransferase [Candidatus Omnitrophota bacterium]
MRKRLRISSIIALLIIGLFFVSGQGYSEDKYEEARREKFDRLRRIMVETQIKARGVSDKNVLEALLKVERHEFVPLELKNFAYTDSPLPIGEGQTISQPYIVALMTELLKLKPGDKVLEIGTGSGYQAAILAEIVEQVYTIEIVESLAKNSARLLTFLGYDNIKVKFADGFLGWPEFAPFNGIIVTCAPKTVPQPLLDQLAEGGRLVVPLGEGFQELKVIEKKNGQIETLDIIPVRFVPMIGLAEEMQ